MAQKFYDSVYRYNDPVRYFKANDPYYFEVDNIPLKQLQENCNFLKDQVGQLNQAQGALDRNSFSELKPFVYGIDNIVYVSSGRYTARINDAYSIDKLSVIEKIGGFAGGEFDEIRYATINNPYIQEAIQKFKSNLAQDALGANGLFERAFTHPTRTPDFRSQYQNYPGTDPGMSWTFASQYWPNVYGALLPYGESDLDAFRGGSVYDQFGSPGLPVGLANLPIFEAAFIKRWRGVARTAVVDVPQTLQIEVPPFDPEDFFYIDRNGNRISLGASATQRIDLLFIYSKPIDSPSTTISKFVNNQPVTINTPTLGLLKGAGIGMNFRSQLTTNPPGPTGEPGTRSTYVKTVDADGNPLMLPSLGDENNNLLGFSGIAGSFASPDDLLNISPLLAETLEYDNISLIGQSILPIAYIVVKNDAQQNVLGTPILTTQDVIDIRPFFRTTELSYNERAGIAAAVPQISLANPVASENYVDFVAKELSDRINVLIPTQGGPVTEILDTIPRIVRSGYILGGRTYGPESTLLDYIRQNNPNGTFPNNDAFNNTLYTQFDYPLSRTISTRPDWDLAAWAQTASYPDRGTSACDWINYSAGRVGPIRTKYGFGSSNVSGTPALKTKEFASYPNLDITNTNNSGGYYSMVYVKKTLVVTKPSWAYDIRVDARLFNCCPLSVAGRTMGSNTSVADSAKFSNIWTSKRKISPTQIEITIFVSWAVDIHRGAYQANPSFSNLGTNPYTASNPNVLLVPSLNRNQYWKFTGFAVVTNNMVSEKDFNMADEFYGGNTNLTSNQSNAFGTAIGTSLYPSVAFDVIAVPANYGVEVNYGSTSEIIL